MRVFFNAIFLQIFLTIYVFYRGWQILPQNRIIRVGYLSIFLFELALYFTGFLGSDYLPTSLLHWITWVGTSWMILISFFGLLLLIFDLMRFVNRKTKLFLKFRHLNPMKTKRIVFIGSLLSVLALMVYGNYNFQHPSVQEFSIHLNKKTENIKKLKIVALSDIHAGNLIDNNLISRYVDLVMAQNPDLILIVGDIIDYDINSVKEQRMEEEFQRLEAPYGVFACTGNHDFIQKENEEELEKISWIEQKSGMILLRDSAVLIDSAFYVVGRDDEKWEARKSTLKAITDNLNKKLPIFVMNHQPHHLQQEIDGGADLAIYGHTHNGQVFPANLLLKFMYELPYGYKKKEDTYVYVSSGIGLAGPQYRIGTVSEIVVFNITFD